MVYVIAGIAALITLFILIVGLFKLIFNASQSPEKIRQKHRGEDPSNYAFVKKYPEANVNNYWWTFFMTGGIISLALMILAFEWTTYENMERDLGKVKKMDEFQVEPPKTKRKQQPPPPPPPQKIDPVDNDEKIDDDPEVPDIDISPDEKVETSDFSPKEEKTNEEEPPVVHAETMPKFPGGKKKMLKYLAQVRYPPIAKENDIEGTVFVRFVVDKQGDVTNVSVKRGPNKHLNEAAVNHVKNMPKWEPGKQRGKKVKVQYVVPIRFELN